jgi:antitoxin ParD1/3/4
MAKTTSVNLNDRWTDFIAERVDQGRFESASEAVRAGLRLLELEEQKLDRLLAEIAKGIESGPSRPFVRGEAASLARSRAKNAA